MALYSSGSTVGLRYIVEATFGVTPTVTPVWKVLRAKPSKITLKKATYTSDEVRSDRGISDLRHGMRSVDGTVDGDLMLNQWDDFIEAALQGTWAIGTPVGSDTCKMGTTLRTFSVEQSFLDITQYRLFKGVAVSKVKVSAKPGALIDISFSLMGQDGISSATAAAGTNAAANTNVPMSYASGTISEGGGGIAYITGIDFELDNGLGAVGVIGANLTPAIFNGRSSIKGTVSALFKDQVMLNKFLNETESSISVNFLDPLVATTSHTILIPRIKYTGGDIAPPKEGAILISLPFEGLYDTPSVSNIVWTRDVTP